MSDAKSDTMTVEALVAELEKAAHGLDVAKFRGAEDVRAAAKMLVAMDSEIRDYEKSMGRANRKVARLLDALNTIGGGRTDRFPGAPPLTDDTMPDEWRGEMWVWSQRVAKSAHSLSLKEEE